MDNKKRAFLIILVLVLLVAGSAVLYVKMGAGLVSQQLSLSNISDEQEKESEAGVIVPDFKIIDINGEEIYYLTHEQRKALDKEFAEEYKACNRERFEKDRNLLDKMFSLLPKLLQDRINLYRKFVPDFRADFEDYELSAVFLSYKIYKHCKADSYESFVKNLEDFDYDRYIRNHEVLKTRGMSINQVQFAQALATGLFRDEMEKKISLSAPTEAMLRMSAVMDMPNALCTIGEIFCTPRKEYIDKYIQG